LVAAAANAFISGSKKTFDVPEKPVDSRVQPVRESFNKSVTELATAAAQAKLSSNDTSGGAADAADDGTPDAIRMADQITTMVNVFLAELNHQIEGEEIDLNKPNVRLAINDAVNAFDQAANAIKDWILTASSNSEPVESKGQLQGAATRLEKAAVAALGNALTVVSENKTAVVVRPSGGVPLPGTPPTSTSASVSAAASSVPTAPKPRVASVAPSMVDAAIEASKAKKQPAPPGAVPPAKKGAVSASVGAAQARPVSAAPSTRTGAGGVVDSVFDSIFGGASCVSSSASAPAASRNDAVSPTPSSGSDTGPKTFSRRNR